MEVTLDEEMLVGVSSGAIHVYNKASISLLGYDGHSPSSRVVWLVACEAGPEPTLVAAETVKA